MGGWFGLMCFPEKNASSFSRNSMAQCSVWLVWCDRCMLNSFCTSILTACQLLQKYWLQPFQNNLQTYRNTSTLHQTPSKRRKIKHYFQNSPKLIPQPELKPKAKPKASKNDTPNQTKTQEETTKAKSFGLPNPPSLCLFCLYPAAQHPGREVQRGPVGEVGHLRDFTQWWARLVGLFEWLGNAGLRLLVIGTWY